MAEKDAAAPAAWYLAPVPHRRHPSQCIHVSIRLWIVSPPPSQLTELKAPTAPRSSLWPLYVGRLQVTPDVPLAAWGVFSMQHSQAVPEQPKAGEGNLWSKRSVIFNEQEVVIWDWGLFWGGRIKRSSVTFAVVCWLPFVLPLISLSDEYYKLFPSLSDLNVKGLLVTK